MDGPFRWVVAILAVAAIIALIAFARGEPQHGEPATRLAGLSIVAPGDPVRTT